MMTWLNTPLSKVTCSVSTTGNPGRMISIVGSTLFDHFQRLYQLKTGISSMSPIVFREKWYFRCPLERAFCHSPEKCLSLLRGHVLTCLQKISHDQRLLNGLCFHPHSAVHSNNHLKGENLLQVLHYFTLRSQKSDGKNNTTIFIWAF